jgi:mono/diheme cytochrome c family protein
VKEKTAGDPLGAVSSALVDPKAPLPGNFAATRLFAGPGLTLPADRVFAYDVKVPLWSDGAQKRRYVYLPPGQSITWDAANQKFVFPVGTVFLKHFEVKNAIPPRPYETRMITLKQDGAWYFTTYKWNDDGTSAKTTDSQLVQVAGGGEYRIPSVKECQMCHTEGKNFVLGFRPDQLDYDPLKSGNELQALISSGAVTARLADLRPATPLTDPRDDSAPLDARARSYLAVNCSPCHYAKGVASIFDFSLDKTLAETRLIEQKAVVPHNPDASRLWQKVSATKAEDRMPPVSLVPDPTALKIFKPWIAAWPTE